MLQISHYTKQYSAGGAKAVDDLSLHMPSCILPRRRSAGIGLDSEAAAGRLLMTRGK